MKELLFACLGYCLGSVLFARLWAKLLGKGDIQLVSKDENPGTANAYVYGGFWCGTLTLFGDLLKGMLPVMLYCVCCDGFQTRPILSALVLSAPVLGHAFPIWNHFCGGKGIAVSFGCLLGLLPVWRPCVILAAVFILLSTVLRITTHFYRTAVTFPSALVIMLLTVREPGILLGFCFVTVIVLLRLHMSGEKRKKFEVKLLWMH